MKLQNVLLHMRNTSIRVNGTLYSIDKDGIAEVADENDARRLLGKSTWRRYIERNPVVSTPPVITKPVVPPKVEEKAVETAPENGDEWPDPKVSMTVKQLREIADAYEVQYDTKTTKKVLVERTMKAMYGEE